MDTAKYKDGVSKMTSKMQKIANHVSKLDFSIPAPTNSEYGMEESSSKPVALKVILLIFLILALTVAGLTYWLL